MVRRPRRPGLLLASLAPLARAGGAADAPPDGGFRILSAYANLSALLARTGGCPPGAAPAPAPGDAEAARLACALGCQTHEEVLDAAFEPWWDHRLSAQAQLEACTIA